MDIIGAASMAMCGMIPGTILISMVIIPVGIIITDIMVSTQDLDTASPVGVVWFQGRVLARMTVMRQSLLLVVACRMIMLSAVELHRLHVVEQQLPVRMAAPPATLRFA